MKQNCFAEMYRTANIIGSGKGRRKTASSLCEALKKTAPPVLDCGAQKLEKSPRQGIFCFRVLYHK